MKALRIIVETAKVYYDNLFHFFVMGSVTVLSFLLILPAPVTSAGMWAVAQRAVRGKGVSWGDYGDGIKAYWKRNVGLSLVLALGYGLAWLNLWFYITPGASPLPEAVSAVMLPLWVVLMVLWTGVAFYAQPFLVELESPTLRLILRNSFFLALLNPLATLVLLLVAALLLAIGYFLPPLFLATPGMILLLRLTAMRACVQSAVEKQSAFQKTGGELSSESEKK